MPEAERVCPVTGRERPAVRREKSVPLLEVFRVWLETWRERAPPKGPLGQAVAYTLANWTRLLRYSQDGRIPIDNNPVEQAIRPVALGRKNWMLVGSVRVGRAAAVYMSLLATANVRGSIRGSACATCSPASRTTPPTASTNSSPAPGNRPPDPLAPRAARRVR